MITNPQYTNIKRVLDNLLDHPMLRDVSLEQAVRYTLRFISLHGYPALYQDKVATVKICDFRGVLPCDLIKIVQVRDKRSGIMLRSMADTFIPALKEHVPKRHINKCACKKDLTNNVFPPAPEGMDRMPCRPDHERSELSFKTQGKVIYTSFPEGEVEIAYKAIPVDDEGYPLLIDNEVYLEALENYIKVKVFTIKFDKGKITAGVLQNAQADYAWAAGQLSEEMNIPSLSEMESITRMINTLIPQVRHFDNGFKNMGDREYIRRH